MVLQMKRFKTGRRGCVCRSRPVLLRTLPAPEALEFADPGAGQSSRALRAEASMSLDLLEFSANH